MDCFEHHSLNQLIIDHLKVFFFFKKKVGQWELKFLTIFACRMREKTLVRLLDGKLLTVGFGGNGGDDGSGNG